MYWRIEDGRHLATEEFDGNTVELSILVHPNGWEGVCEIEFNGAEMRLSTPVLDSICSAKVMIRQDTKNWIRDTMKAIQGLHGRLERF